MIRSIRRTLIIGSIIAAAVGIRLVLALLPGYAADQRLWAELATITLKVGVPNLYANTQVNADMGIYPPLYHYLLALVGLIYTRFFSPDFANLSFSVNFALKLVPILGDCALGLAVFLGLRPDVGNRKAFIAVAAILFSPGILFASAYWGMFGDSLLALFIVIALLAILHDRVTLAWCAMVAGIFFKPQALVFVPLIAVAGLQSSLPSKIIRATPASLAVMITIWLPFALAGTLADAVDALTLTVGLFPNISLNAYNAWWLAAGGDGWRSDADPLLGPFTARTIGLIAFAALVIATLFWSMRVPVRDRLIKAAAFIGFAFFMVNTEMHENYLFPTVCLLALLIVHPGPHRWIAVAVNITWLANMLLADPLLRDTLLISWPISTLSLGISAANVIILVIWSIVLLRDPTPANQPAIPQPLLDQGAA